MKRRSPAILLQPGDRSSFPTDSRALTPSQRELLGKINHPRLLSSVPGTLPFSPLRKSPNLLHKAAKSQNPFALPSQGNATQLPYSRVIGCDSCISSGRIKKKERKKKGKERKPLLASEITRKVTFLMLTHTKRAQPLISADHMLPLLLARS